MLYILREPATSRGFTQRAGALSPAKPKETDTMNTQFQAIIDKMPTNSAWARGVKATAFDLLERMEENGIESPTMTSLLNGAQDWNQWAWGGCGLIYDADIAERYCNTSELKRTRNGERRPNRNEDWLDVEARAAGQAAAYIVRAAKRINAA